MKIKFVIVNLLNIINKIVYSTKEIIFRPTLFIFSKINIAKNNKLVLQLSKIIRSKINIEGTNNNISIKGMLCDSKVYISGKGNTVLIDKGVELRNSKITLIGNHCNINISSNSTFGGINMVCMGKNNYIIIGKNCMFAHDVELWATDSHPIFNYSGEIINKSLPITIEDNVWIGAKVCILKGVTIGHGTIVGIASVVSKSLPEKSICVGNPAVLKRSGILKWDRTFIKE